MKRILTFCLALVMLVGLMPATSIPVMAQSYPNNYTNTGNHRNDIIGVAETQLGYKEGDEAEAGDPANYSKYGDAYGSPAGHWCAYFVSWCARQAGIPTDILRDASVATPHDYYGYGFKIDSYYGTSYTPQPGDIFFLLDESHVGLVYYIEGDYFYTIEGNWGDQVTSVKRLIKDYIFGVPAYVDDSYLSECESYSSHCSVKVDKAATVKSLPCTNAENADSADVETAAAGANYEAIRLYKNTAGELWYKVLLEDGGIGYLYSGDTEPLGLNYDDVTITDTVAPTVIKQGNRFSIEGKIDAKYLTITSIYAKAVDIATGSVLTGKPIDVKTQSYGLYYSDADWALSFGSLPVGKHLYILEVTVTNSYAATPTTVASDSETIILYEGTFNIVADNSCKHTYIDTVTPPTCSDPGYTSYTCTKCGISYESDYVAPIECSFAPDVIPPSCTQEGYTVYSCIYCGYTYLDDSVAPTGHSYGDWYQTQAPTGTQPGQERRDCQNCDHYETREVPATGEIDPNAPQIVIDSVTAAPGKTVDVAVSLKNNPGINTFTLTIHYDTSKLALTGVTASSALGGTFIFNDKTATVVWQSSSDTTYNGEVFTLHFAVLDGSEGDAAVTLSYKSGNICNYDEVDVDFAILAGGVSVLEYLPGDINGDGVVNNKDLNRLMKYLTDDTTEVNAAALDVNGDGAVNNKDLNRLMKYLTDDTVEIH